MTKPLTVLRKRAQFLAIADASKSKLGKKWVAPGLIMQVGAPHDAAPTIQYGLTASSKIGNAVKRNRARRRLRALVTEILVNAAPEHDYVLIAREATITRDYADLRQDLVTGLQRLKLWRA